jgi:hypothetical protein
MTLICMNNNSLLRVIFEKVMKVLKACSGHIIEQTGHAMLPFHAVTDYSVLEWCGIQQHKEHLHCCVIGLRIVNDLGVPASAHIETSKIDALSVMPTKICE